MDSESEMRTKDIKSAWEVLFKGGYVMENMILRPEVISTILFQLADISSGMPKKMIEGVKALVVILREEGWKMFEEGVKGMVEEVCRGVKEQVEETMKAAVESMEGMVAQMGKCTDDMIISTTVSTMPVSQLSVQ